ncbi:SGNH/GDSL hydrolase family protein [Anabaena sp. UHCC 0204]|uniref:SGNH/GDSL hydrolase family protein n=1 Tax=Anabaena sp. UHCC 0204 TaxID=2590009 RepID=UPI0020C33531|nr:SGNH/GDSL hydrolase family protein [Anabaena sp. UHCC 0204]
MSCKAYHGKCTGASPKIRMKKQLVTAGFVLFSFMLPAKASAISQVYVFGDSLVDNSNVFTVSGGTFPPFPYFPGRFSNGPVWTESLADDLGLGKKLNNFAFGGATTGDTNNINAAYPQFPQLPNLPGLTQQIQGFAGLNPKADKNALYIISAGANDYLSIPDFTNNALIGQTINNAVSNLENAILSLSVVGAKNFLIANLPNLGDIPANNKTPLANSLNSLTAFHNSKLSQTINGLNQEKPNLNIKIFDVNSVVSQIIASPTTFGFTNVTDACLNIVEETMCSNPDKYLFWDNLHPTTAAHDIVAESARAMIPEPPTTLSLLGMAALGATGVIKRKRKTLNSTNLVLAGQSSHTKVES